MSSGAIGDFEPAVIGVARQEPIDVNRALEAARSINRDEELATELVRIAIDVDEGTVNALLRAVGWIKDEMWRAGRSSAFFAR